MAETRNPAPKKDDDKPTGDAAKAVGDVPEQVAEANARGFYGHRVDPTPPENYTLAGVNAGKPTPETERRG